MLSFVGRLLSGEKIPDPVLTPPGFSGAKLPSIDDEEPDTPLSLEDGIDVFGQAFLLFYKDSKGELSERRVIGRACYNLNENIMFQAKCLERQATRTFRVDRIQELYCGVTGEKLSPINEYISPTETREVSNNKMLNPLRAATRILMTLARSDGYVHPKEIDVLDNFLDMVQGESGSSVNIENLRNYARKLAPDFENFLETAQAAFRGSRMFGYHLIEAARILVKSDGTVTNNEHILIDDLMHLARAKGIIEHGDRLTPL